MFWGFILWLFWVVFFGVIGIEVVVVRVVGVGFLVVWVLGEDELSVV